MREVQVGLLSLLMVGLVVTPASASFVNGGFETGDTSGWTITGDHSVISSFTPQFNNTTGWTSGIPYYGNYSLLLGSPDVGNVWDDAHSSTGVQASIITQADVDAGLHLYFRWGAILEEPTNVFHENGEQPYFSIEISAHDGGAWNQIYFEDHRANEPGFTFIGTNATGDAGDIWYGTDIANIDLLGLGLGVGEDLKIDLFVKDCSLGGHGGLVFLDGFGTTSLPPVPIPSAVWLLASGLVGLVGCRKWFKK